MSFTVSSNIPSPATLDKATQGQGAAEQSARESLAKDGSSVSQGVNDNVSLSQSNELSSQDVTRGSNESPEVRESSELDAEGAMKALLMVKNSILQKSDVSLQSQANHKPEAALDLLSNDVK